MPPKQTEASKKQSKSARKGTARSGRSAAKGAAPDEEPTETSSAPAEQNAATPAAGKNGSAKSGAAAAKSRGRKAGTTSRGAQKDGQKGKAGASGKETPKRGAKAQAPPADDQAQGTDPMTQNDSAAATVEAAEAGDAVAVALTENSSAQESPAIPDSTTDAVEATPASEKTSESGATSRSKRTQSAAANKKPRGTKGTDARKSRAKTAKSKNAANGPGKTTSRRPGAKATSPTTPEAEGNPETRPELTLEEEQQAAVAEATALVTEGAADQAEHPAIAQPPAAPVEEPPQATGDTFNPTDEGSEGNADPGETEEANETGDTLSVPEAVSEPAEDGAEAGPGQETGDTETPRAKLPVPGEIKDEWMLHTTATTEMHDEALNAVIDLLPELVSRHLQRRLYHASGAQRHHDNAVLSSLLGLENDLLELQRRPHHNVGPILLREGREYPEEIARAIEAFVKVNQALYGHMMAEDVTNLWFQHAVEFGGPDTITLADLKQSWVDQWPRIIQEPEIGEALKYELQVHLESSVMPPRAKVRVGGGNSRSGFAGVAFNPEAGYEAVRQMAHVKLAGIRAKEQYPAE